MERFVSLAILVLTRYDRVRAFGSDVQYIFFALSQGTPKRIGKERFGDRRTESRFDK